MQRGIGKSVRQSKGAKRHATPTVRRGPTFAFSQKWLWYSAESRSAGENSAERIYRDGIKAPRKARRQPDRKSRMRAKISEELWLAWKLAGMGGFEPPNGGIKIRCLTTWLHPIRRQPVYRCSTGPARCGGGGVKEGTRGEHCVLLSMWLTPNAFASQSSADHNQSWSLLVSAYQSGGGSIFLRFRTSHPLPGCSAESLPTER